MTESSIAWRIYYDDGSTFDSSMGEPEDVLAFGVICIVYPNDLVGRQIMWGWDWYYWVPGENNWWGSDIHGLLDRLLHRLPSECICQGRNVSNEVFRSIMDAADKDPDFPPKSGKIRGEHP